MAALEWRVLSEILRDQNWYPVIKQQLNREHFRDGEAKLIFEYLRKHWEHPDTIKELPSERSIKRRFPGFQKTAKGAEEAGKLATLIRELKLTSMSTDLLGYANSVVELAEDDDPVEALGIMRSLMNSIQFQHVAKGAVGMREVARRAKQKYQDAKDGIAYGIPWPWEPLTYDTMGKNPSQLILIYARQKQMKTWIELVSAVEDFMLHKQRVLIWSKEMDIDELCVRIACIIAKVDYQLAEHGALPPHVEDQYLSTLDYVEGLVGRSDGERKEMKDRHLEDLILLCGRDAPRTLSELNGAIDANEPDICYLDSVHHLDAEKGGRTDNDKQRNIAEGIKQTAIDTRIPMVCTYHANRAGEKDYGDTLSDIGRSDAWGGEIDLGLRLVKRKVKEVFEEDYEGYWEKKDEAQKQRLKKRAVLVGLRVNKKAPAMAKRRLEPPVIEGPRNARTQAEVAILVSGARRGVLDGILIRALPATDFSLIDPDMNKRKVEKWLGEAKDDDDDDGPVRNGATGRGSPAKNMYKPNSGAMKKLRKR